MLQQLIQFIVKHWALVAAFVAMLGWLLIEEAKAQGGANKLTPAGVTHAINRENALLIDVRDASAYRAGHIVGAENVSSSDFSRQQEKWDKQRMIVLIDAMGTKTAPLLMQLKKAGFEKAHLLKGGMHAWESAHMPVIKNGKK